MYIHAESKEQRSTHVIISIITTDGIGIHEVFAAAKQRGRRTGISVWVMLCTPIVTCNNDLSVRMENNNNAPQL